ncbi:alpha-xylosidase [Microbacterium sp.]|uniref:alpha-xylosidase n=1 Tax=Microbacterium sp. TaxID=51671 RepID=UPI003A860E82
MKFTDGFWLTRPGVTALYARDAYDVDRIDTPDGAGLIVTAPTAPVRGRGDTLNRSTLTVILSAPAEGVIRVRVAHHLGGREPDRFVPDQPGSIGNVAVDAGGGVLTAGLLAARVHRGEGWQVDFTVDGTRVTGSGWRSLGYVSLAEDADVHPGLPSNRAIDCGVPSASAFVHEQLDLGVGEMIYGLGERFGPFVKNGQAVDIWNADGGTSSDQAYKNVPFYLSSAGYGVLVNDTGPVSFEVGSEAVERVQFSVPGEVLEYFVIAGPTPADVLRRYTALAGRAPAVPAWSYGLWLSTSFTTDYDEQTVNGFLDEMERRDLPVSVFHFDTFWMREFNWCDFTWDPRVFPDPDGMLDRLHARDLRVSVWINPYIGQRSPLFAEAAGAGYLVRRPDGSVWQTDMWQAGMGAVDFTNPEAGRWFQGKLRELIAQGVDCFKTDFGERIPTDVAWADGSDPARTHNRYTQLYNRAVWEVLVAERGRDDAVLFARSATAGGQTMPVHWGGDNTSSFVSMAESLRGGLSLAVSGFAYWSHDIGGFEGTPDAAVFKRWVAFGLLSSHSRLHGSGSYRVPWLFDEEAVAVTRAFTQLKMRLMPYLYQLGVDAGQTGMPLMRPMVLEFPDDPTAAFLDRQYMLGPDVLVAPVFSASGEVAFYLPEGEWTGLLTGATVSGGRWIREVHGFDSLPIYVRPGAVIPWGARIDRPDYDYLDGLQLRVFPGGSGTAEVTVTTPTGQQHRFAVDRATVTER